MRTGVIRAIGDTRCETHSSTMLEGVGKKLHDVRVQRGLSVEEVAHATKLRPDKILALEHDDYARFANNAYAKGFLQIYGRYLGVDISEPWQALDTANLIKVTDYQYLTNGIQQHEPERATFSFSLEKGRRRSCRWWCLW